MGKKSWLLVFIVVSLLLVFLPACGGNGEPTVTSNVTETPTPTTSTVTPTQSPVSSGPVKIGAITSWSGPGAMYGTGVVDPVIKLVEKQVKDTGGILGGREVKVVRYDNRASVAEATAGATKLFYDDKVSALVFGGISGAEQEAISTFAEEHKIMFVGQGTLPSNTAHHFSLSATWGNDAFAVPIFNIIDKVLHAKTVAILGSDLADSRERVGAYKARIAQDELPVIYEQYAPVGVTDFSPYLTKIKFDDPDVLVLDVLAMQDYVALAKQIMDLGGWGDIKVITIPGGDAAIKMPGASGWYILVAWAPGLSYPGAVKFEQDYKAMHGSLPSTVAAYPYNCLWTAIYAIELAGSDEPEKIGQAAQSGNLEWESPMGYAHYTKELEGYPGLFPTIVHVENGQLVIVPIPD